MLLFLLGMVTGRYERHFANMHMALYAHLQGVLNGTFLTETGAEQRDRKRRGRTVGLIARFRFSTVSLRRIVGPGDAEFHPGDVPGLIRCRGPFILR